MEESKFIAVITPQSEKTSASEITASRNIAKTYKRRGLIALLLGSCLLAAGAVLFIHHSKNTTVDNVTVVNTIAKHLSGNHHFINSVYS
jgi:hypothetical protein